MYLCDILPEKWWDAKKAFFLLYPAIEIANFTQRDRDNGNAHSVCICVYSPCCTLLTYTLTAWDIVSLFIFARRLAMPDSDELNKSHAFLMPITFVLLIL